MTDLKPCPFCGGNADYVKHSAGVPRTMAFDSWHAAACRSCGATVGACDRRFRNKDDAAAAWNLRPAGVRAAVLPDLRKQIEDALQAGLGHTWQSARNAHFPGGSAEYSAQAQNIEKVLAEVRAYAVRDQS